MGIPSLLIDNVIKNNDYYSSFKKDVYIIISYIYMNYPNVYPPIHTSAFFYWKITEKYSYYSNNQPILQVIYSINKSQIKYSL